jgi:hypothetical protein
LQLFGHVYLEQSSPVKLGSQIHFPFKHIPFAEHSLGQVINEQSFPLNPLSQKQNPYLHYPLLLQLLGQYSFSHAIP